MDISSGIEAKQESARFDWRKLIVPGTWLDVRNTKEEWCVGSVVEVKESGRVLSVRLDGWPPKPLDVPTKSERLAAFRSKTRGYTGDRKQNHRFFIFQEAEVNAAADQLLKIFDSPIDPYKFTQFVRGQAFVLLDSLLTTFFAVQKVIVTKQFDITLHLIDSFLIAYEKWLEMLPGPTSFGTEMHTVSPRAAVLAAAPEFSEVLTLLLGLNDRSKDAIKKLGTYFGTEGSPMPELWLPEHVIGQLEKGKGFRGFVEAMRESPVDVRTLAEVLTPYASAKRLAKAGMIAEVREGGRAALEGRLEKADEKELKGLGEAFFETLYETLASLQDTAQREQTLSVLLRLAIKFLHSPNKADKTTGIRIINRMVGVKKLGASVDFAWTSNSALAKGLNDGEVVQAIFGESAHEEIIKQSGEVLHFLLGLGELSVPALSTIWRCCTEKHEGLSLAALELLTLLLSSLPSTLLAALGKELMKIPSRDFTEPLISFAKEHVITATRLQGTEGDSGEQIYNLDLFWNVICDSPNDSLRDLSTASLCLIISQNDTYKSEFIQKAGMCILSQPASIPAVVRFLLKLDFAKSLVSTKADEPGTEKLDAFLKDNNVIHSVFSHCTEYHRRVADVIKSHPDLRRDLPNLCIHPGEMRFADQSRLYLDLVLYVCLANSGTAGEILALTWDCYYQNAIAEEHMNLLFDMLMQESEPSLLVSTPKSIGPFASPSAVQGFLAKYLADETKMAVDKASASAYHCFERYFRLANEDLFKRAFVPENLTGTAMLWKLALETRNELVEAGAMDQLVRIYKDSIRNASEDKRQPVEDFIRVALSRAGGEKAGRILKVLDILEVFIGA